MADFIKNTYIIITISGLLQMGNRHQTKVRRRIRQANTRSIVSKLIHNTIGTTSKRKEACKREIRKKNCRDQVNKPVTLKVGWINVNGLGPENSQAVIDLLSNRALDVRKYIYHFKCMFYNRYWHSVKPNIGQIVQETTSRSLAI